MPRCDCADFDVQVERINGPIVLQQVRSGVRVAADYFTAWTFCPWCGQRLREFPATDVVALLDQDSKP